MMLILALQVASRPTELPGCELQWQPFENVADSFLAQQPEETYVQDPADPGAIDLVPSNHEYNTRYFGIIQSYVAPENVTRLLVPSSDGRVYEGRCSLDTPDGTWVTQRVGPLNSTGGYDCACPSLEPWRRWFRRSGAAHICPRPDPRACQGGTSSGATLARRSIGRSAGSST